MVVATGRRDWIRPLVVLAQTCRCPFHDWTGLCRALGLTQGELAGLLSLSQSRVSRVFTTDPAQHHCLSEQALRILRYELQDPARLETLRHAHYPHPFPEDCA